MAYQHIAPLYDHLMQHAPYDQWVTFSTEIFNNYGNDTQKIIDLGCGTGEIAVRLASKGYQIFGVDNSLEMLSYAEQKAFEKNLSIQWFHQDLRQLDGFNELDAAISYCDVINYVTLENELKDVFNQVYRLLKEDGIFIFDIHSLDYAQNHLINETFTEVTDEICYIWECIAGDEQGEMHHELTFFTLEGDKYNRFDEYHHQRTYPFQFYQNLLKETGFEKINIYADFSLKKVNFPENAHRIFFLAQKRSR